MRQAAKLQRWLDLIAALLDRHYGATLVELRGAVPAYAKGRAESARRTFERDKDELRKLGVPIVTTGDPGDPEPRYLLRPGTFYLPYLALASERGLKRPRRIDRHGYAAIGDCEFTPDELALLADAAARAAELGDPELAADARRAVAKLALDVPRDAITPTPGVQVAPTTPAADATTLAAITDALLRRKQLSFTYYGIERDETERRTVFPYGLTYTSGHWYLHGHDPARGAVRRFRVSRMHEVTVNPKAPGTEDFEIPASFSLHEVARNVPPWALGDDPPVEATLRFHAANGHSRAARKLGTATRHDPATARFHVRRREPFLRWVLSLGGDARPMAPPDLVREFDALVTRTAEAAE